MQVRLPYGRGELGVFLQVLFKIKRYLKRTLVIVYKLVIQHLDIEKVIIDLKCVVFLSYLGDFLEEFFGHSYPFGLVGKRSCKMNQNTAVKLFRPCFRSQDIMGLGK